MKASMFFLALFTIVSIIGCVQKTHKKVVVYTLTVNEFNDSIKSVGVRGQNLPLNWDDDVPLQAIGDNKYQAIVVYNTGFKQTQVKFTINNNFELKDGENRKVWFDKNDTTYVNAIFNKP